MSEGLDFDLEDKIAHASRKGKGPFAIFGLALGSIGGMVYCAATKGDHPLLYDMLGGSAVGYALGYALDNYFYREYKNKE